ncbi:MAG: hypothetical protein LBK60_08020, partial [Verrucomicrobiales bacterium]|nr:hypothetical protein [Verrucomicrobiales bacterium]
AWPHGRMAAWPHGRMAAWPHGRMAAWPHGRMAAWPQQAQQHQTDQWHNHFYYNRAIIKSFLNFYHNIFNIFYSQPIHPSSA